MSRDPGTKLLTVKSQSKSRIESVDTTISFVSLGAGVLLVLVGLAFFGFA
jgi:hypothetical protein